MREPLSILVFPTLPAHLNSNPDIPVYALAALRRAAPPGTGLIESPIGLAEDVIAARRPRLAIGIGSVARGETDFAALWRATRATGTVLAYWLHDEPYEFDFAWRVLDRCDWLFGNDRSALDFYNRTSVSHLPLAASLDHHFRPLVPLARRDHDVFFCGYGYPNRRELLVRLRRSLSAVGTRVLGAGWPDDLPFCRNRRLSTADIAEGYGSARLTLNIGRHRNLANRKLDLVASTPGPRTFEAAAAGALQAVFTEGLEIADAFRLGTEVLAFDNVPDFEDLLGSVLREPERYDPVVKAGQDRARADHTYDARMRLLLSTLAEAGLLPEIA